MSQENPIIDPEVERDFWRHAAVADIIKDLRIQTAALCTLGQTSKELEAIAEYFENFAKFLREQAANVRAKEEAL